MWKILFVDDNLDYIDSFAQAFTGELQVEGFRAKDLLATDFPWHKKQYDAALIDLLMPELDGISLWNQIQLKFKIPPLFFVISEHFHGKFRENALQNGAEDYLHKEMSYVEIKLRLLNRLRKQAQSPETEEVSSSQRALGNLLLEVEKMVCAIEEQMVNLTRTEFLVLNALMSTPQYKLARPHLIKKVWPDKSVVKQTLNTHIFNLNAKLLDWSHQLSVDKNENVHIKPRV